MFGIMTSADLVFGESFLVHRWNLFPDMVEGPGRSGGLFCKDTSPMHELSISQRPHLPILPYCPLGFQHMSLGEGHNIQAIAGSH